MVLGEFIHTIVNVSSRKEFVRSDVSQKERNGFYLQTEMNRKNGEFLTSTKKKTKRDREG
jgi:hypothetical protein